ncbi:MAG: periplasmic heavy metal sensor [Chlorobium sp.]|nr:MAG: periplasmic heavy metal sensor [Chlorobium sp.]
MAVMPAFLYQEKIDPDHTMNFLASKRLVTTALVLLAVFNVALLGLLFWQNTCRVRQTPAGHQFGFHPVFEKSLALTPSQALSFRQLRRQHFIKVRPEIESIALLKQQLVEESLKENPDNTKLDNIASSIGFRQIALERELAEHFHELAKVCTPTQRDSLKQILNQLTAHKQAMRMGRWMEQRQ